MTVQLHLGDCLEILPMLWAARDLNMEFGNFEEVENVERMIKTLEAAIQAAKDAGDD